MSTPAKGLVVPACPVTATDSVEKSALLASEGRAAPVAPLLTPASSAAPVRPASNARFWAPPPVLRRTVPPWRGPEAGAPATFCCGVSGGTREAKVSAKSACWFAGAAAVDPAVGGPEAGDPEAGDLTTAILVSGAKAASSALSTYRPLVGMVME